MNTEHPIDDLFARTLRDAELDPPQQVWQSVVRNRDVANNANSRRWRRRGYAALLLLLLGTPTVWLSVRHNDDSNIAPPQNANSEVVIAEQNDANAVKAPTTRSATEQMTNGSTATEQRTDQTLATNRVERPKTADPARTEKSVVANGKASHAGISMVIGSNKRIAERTDPVPTNATKNLGVPSGHSAIIEHGSDVSVAICAPSITEPTIVLAVMDRQGADGAAAHWIDPLAIDIPRRTDSASLTQREITPYVIRNGNWWIGVQLDVAEMSGTWNGSAQLDAEMNKAETWRDQRGVSLLLGRSWNSGFSLATGIGLTQRRSNYFHQVDRDGNSSMSIDTNWVGSPLGVTTVYTWNIDTIHVGEPGQHEKFNATNSYWQLRVPIELGFHKQVRRWSFGVRGGLLLSFTTSRNGHTLELVPSPADSLGNAGYFTRSIPLRQNSVDDRFAFSLAATAGLDIGYLIGDRLRVGIGPNYVHSLTGGSGPLRLSSEEIGGALRLIYELPAHERTIVK